MISCGRDDVQLGNWVLTKIIDFKVFSGFDCENDDLNDFILNDAAPHKMELLAETYAFKLKDEGGRISVPLAFVSLLNDSIKLQTNRQKRPIPNSMRTYPGLPAVKIGRLGVHADYHRGGIGTRLLNCIKVLFTTNNRTGCRFLTVDAYNEECTLDFYGKNEFMFLYNQDAEKQTRIMYYDLKKFSTCPESTSN